MKGLRFIKSPPLVLQLIISSGIEQDVLSVDGTDCLDDQGLV